MRLAKAQSQLGEYLDSSEFYDLTNDDNGLPQADGDDLRKKKENELREKYDIPKGVYLFYKGIESAITPQEANRCKPHLSAWVKGKLTEDQCNDIYFYFEEMSQADWGWIMLERPLQYYDAAHDDDQESIRLDDDQEAIRLEMESIGTRSRSKNNKLSPLIDGALFK